MNTVLDGVNQKTAPVEARERPEFADAVISEFHQQVAETAFAELERSRKRLGDLSQDQEEALRVMINSIINKFTRPMIKQLRESEDGRSPYLAAWRGMRHRNPHK